MVISDSFRIKIFKKNGSIIFLCLTLAAFLHIFSGAAFCSGEISIISCHETVTLNAEGGAAVSVDLTLSGTGGQLLIPCSYKNPKNIKLIDGTLETILHTTNIGGAEFINYNGALNNQTDITVKYNATGVYNPEDLKSKDFSNTEVKYSFINNSGLAISSFEVMIILPAGLAINRVDDYSPRLKKDDPNAPYVLLIKDGHRALKLNTSDMKYGGRVSMIFKMKPEKRSLAILFIFIIASLWYLFAFRDIINPREHKETAKKDAEPAAEKNKE
jgi:hypothetical protein